MIVFKNSDQLKSFMKRESLRLKIGIPNTYNTFFSRKFLERISFGNKGMFLVKGSFSQYVHLGYLVRPITDVDVVTRESGSDVIDYINDVIKEPSEDEIKFEITGVSKPSALNVMKVRGKAIVDKVVHPIHMDLQEKSSRIYEMAYLPVLPIFEDDETYYINTTSMEEHLAEKLCIISETITNNKQFSRMKDFFDVYQLHGGEYDYNKLSFYYYKMMKNRGEANLSDVTTTPLSKEFVEDHRKIWELMSAKYEFLNDVSIEEAVFYTRAVLSEQLQKAKSLTLKHF